MKHALRAIGCFCIWVALCLAPVCQLVSLATDAPLLQDLMEKHSAASGVDPKALPLLASRIAGYLSGQLDSLQSNASKDKAGLPCFSENDILHMKDVRNLIESGTNLCRFIWPSLLLFMLSLVPCFLYKKSDLLFEASLRVSIAGSAFILLILFFGTWAALDFNSVFVVFHKVLFTNDLWLLDPSTDLMIQLMPLPLFVDYALVLLKRLLPIAGLIALSAFITLHQHKKRGISYEHHPANR